MATALDRVAPRVALQMIRQFGKRITVAEEQGQYNPATGRRETSPVAYRVVALLTSYSSHEIGDVIQAGDVKVLIPARALDGKHTEIAVTQDPATGAFTETVTADKVSRGPGAHADFRPDNRRLLIDGIMHSVIRVDPLYSGEQVALLTVQARRQ